MEILQLILFIVIWFALQKWLLPKLGIPTWMSPDVCRVPDTEKKANDDDEKDT